MFFLQLSDNGFYSLHDAVYQIVMRSEKSRGTQRMEEYLQATADESSRLKHGICARRHDD